MPKNIYTLWGYGLLIDKKGDYVDKPMAQSMGKEILTELIHQLGFQDILDEALASTDVTTVMLPYASAMFACRVPEDRRLVIPEGAENFAFLGQFVELPEDIVYTVEYSVHPLSLHIGFPEPGHQRSDCWTSAAIVTEFATTRPSRVQGLNM